jgi:hypothetical protein
LLSFDKLNFTTDVFDTKKKIIKINDIILEHPLYAEYNYPGLRPKRKSAAAQTATLSSSRWNEEDWVIQVNNIFIKDGGLTIDRKTIREPRSNRFDEDHIIASALNGSFKNVEFIKDTLRANIDIAVKDRSGFEIKKLNAEFKFTPKEMEFKNLDLITNRSRLKDYYAMRYQNFIDDMSNFNHAVTLEGNFEGSNISSDDLAFFAPELKRWNRNFFISGYAGGTIDNLTGKNLK